MRYSDRPITRIKEDLLGRASFAKRLAHAIDQLAVAKDGFVIAIHGPWGSGKTSVVELILRYLQYIEMERASQNPLPGASTANPVTIDELDDLADLFEQVRPQVEALEKAGSNLTYWERIERIKDFRKWLANEDEAQGCDRFWQLKFNVEQNPKTIVVRFSPWLIAGRSELASALLAELARGLGDSVGTDVKQAFGDVLRRLAELAPFAGSAFELASGMKISQLFSAGGAWAGNLATQMTTGPTLDALRQRLRQALLKLHDQKVLVVLDDLDRLTPSEGFRMVSLVKSLGDLPNVVYLLSYENEKLAKLIRSKSKLDGYEFLDKIVQYQVALPPVDEDELADLLRADLFELTGDLRPDEQAELDEIWSFVLRRYFKTPRAVRRFVNSVAIAIPALGEQLDPIDIILLEAIRLSDPNIYEWIRSNLLEITE